MSLLLFGQVGFALPLADLISKEISSKQVKGKLDYIEFHGGDQQTQDHVKKANFNYSYNIVIMDLPADHFILEDSYFLRKILRKRSIFQEYRENTEYWGSMVWNKLLGTE